MEKPIIVYILFALMISTAIIYFIVASFGENLEEEESHKAKAAAETGQENIEGTPQHEDLENGHTVIAGNKKAAETNHENIPVIQHNEVAERGNGRLENRTAIEGSSGKESSKRSLELPLFLSVAIAYVMIGLWMVIDKKSSKIPYIISTAGSVVLIGLYIVSHTVGLPLIGLEHVGFLDLFVTALQVGIVVVSGYVVIMPSSKTITRTQTY